MRFQLERRRIDSLTPGEMMKAFKQALNRVSTMSALIAENTTESIRHAGSDMNLPLLVQDIETLLVCVRAFWGSHFTTEQLSVISSDDFARIGRFEELKGSVIGLSNAAKALLGVRDLGASWQPKVQPHSDSSTASGRDTIDGMQAGIIERWLIPFAREVAPLAEAMGARNFTETWGGVPNVDPLTDLKAYVLFPKKAPDGKGSQEGAS